MIQLSKFSPAETMLILEGTAAPLKDLLKLTFMDLFLKQVIKTIDVQKPVSGTDEVLVYQYIVAGKNFWSYKPLPHENLFLSPFQRNDSAQIYFRNLVKVGYQKARSQSNLHKLVLTNSDLSGCYSRSLMQKMFGGFTLTKDGSELRKKVKAELAQLEEQLPQMIANAPEKAMNVLKTIKGNVFLLPTIEFDLLKQLDKDFSAEMNNQMQSDFSIGCSTFTWDSFDSYSDGFDSGCSSADSGCGGSGCSGCGGGD